MYEDRERDKRVRTSVWYVQQLQRFNDAIARDYVIPFRVVGETEPPPPPPPGN